MVFWTIFLVLPMVIFASAYRQCFWSNFINAINVVLSAAVAVSYAMPLANLLADQAAAWTSYTELLTMWAIFLLVFTISRTVCSTISTYPVRFGEKVDTIADFAGCFLVTVAMQGFVTFSLFAAPIGAEPFVEMMRVGIVSSEGRLFGQLVVEIPSQLGMGGNEFDMDEWAKSRLKRATDENNNK